MLGSQPAEHPSTFCRTSIVELEDAILSSCFRGVCVVWQVWEAPETVIWEVDVIHAIRKTRNDNRFGDFPKRINEQPYRSDVNGRSWGRQSFSSQAGGRHGESFFP